MNAIFKENEEFRSTLSPQLINRAHGAEILSLCPHEDISPEITAIAVSGTNRIPVTYSDAAHHQLTQGEVMDAARQNQAEQPYRLAPMADILGLSSEESGPVQLLVLTNRQANLGSGEVLNPTAMDDAAYRLGSPELYVIPSSTHEVLLLSRNSGITPNELDTLVHEVNETVVAPRDRLSDHALVYDNRTRTLAEARAAEVLDVEKSFRQTDRNPEAPLDRASEDNVAVRVTEEAHERRHHS